MQVQETNQTTTANIPTTTKVVTTDNNMMDVLDLHPTEEEDINDEVARLHKQLGLTDTPTPTPTPTRTSTPTPKPIEKNVEPENNKKDIPTKNEEHHEKQTTLKSIVTRPKESYRTSQKNKPTEAYIPQPESRPHDRMQHPQQHHHHQHHRMTTPEGYAPISGMMFDLFQMVTRLNQHVGEAKKNEMIREGLLRRNNCNNHKRF